jgi:hypothetical protein
MVAQMPELFETLTGMKISQMLGRLQSVDARVIDARPVDGPPANGATNGATNGAPAPAVPDEKER